MARSSFYAQFVHQYNGKYVVAECKDGQYFAPMNPRAKKLTGCTIAFSNSLGGLLDSGAYWYATRSAALKRARECFLDVEAELSNASSIADRD